MTRKANLINTLLQQGGRQGRGYLNCFSSFLCPGETAEAVAISARSRLTPLKRGVNENIVATANPSREISGLSHAASDCQRAAFNGQFSLFTFHFSLPFILIGFFLAVSAPAQNIVELDGSARTLPALHLSESDLAVVIQRAPEFKPPPSNPDAQRLAAKLDAHVTELLDGFPWRPFHHTLGISGYETGFGHPDELFHALAVALPQLPPATAARVKALLQQQLAAGVLPFAAEGPDWSRGRAREAYAVPETLRARKPAAAASRFGLYSFWAYCHYAADAASAKTFWPQVKTAAADLLAKEYAFDPARRGAGNDEAEKLNGDLAGLIGLIRLARLNGEAAVEQSARARARQLLELRVNLERLNPRILEPTRSASKSLHNFKLARYCALIPEAAEAVRIHSEGLAAERLGAFRSERNGWFMAFGDRLVGGENYTNPLHLSRALFAGAVFIEQAPAGQLADWVDVPWCRGDLYFLEKCAWALWRAGGAAWQAAE